MIGDAQPSFASGVNQDFATPTAYDPNSPSRFFDLQYYRDQISAFQDAVNNLDQTSAQMQALLTIDSLDSESRTAAEQWLANFDAKKFEIKAAADAINGVVSVAGSLGVTVPSIVMPQSLSFAPVAIAGIAIAVAAATAIVAWSIEQIAVAHSIASTANARLATIANLPPDQQARALAVEQGIAQSQAANQTSFTGNLAQIAKWAAIAAAIWFGYKALKEYKLIAA